MSIDGFLNSALRQAGLAPAAMAGKSALARRLAFDLTGLPPSGTRQKPRFSLYRSAPRR